MQEEGGGREAGRGQQPPFPMIPTISMQRTGKHLIILPKTTHHLPTAGTEKERKPQSTDCF